MADTGKITIYGFAASTYVRSARMACEEKGVGYALEPVEFGSDGHRAAHPFAMIPAMRHGDFALWETSAIMRYVDEAFDGPALAPADPRGRARMEQWISAGNAYVDGPVVRDIVIQRLVVPSRGGAPDEARVAAAVPKAERALGAMDAALGETAFLAGEAVSLADFLIVPMITYLRQTPEGKAMVPELGNVERWYKAMKARPSFGATLPEPAGESAAE